MSFSNFLETAILNHILNDGAYTAPTNPHVALCSAGPVEGDTGSTITEVAYTGYARVSTAAADWNAASAANPSTKDNANAITFPIATGGTATAKHFAIVSASSAGDLMLFGMLATGIATFFADASDDIIDAPAHGFSADDKVVFIGENLPAGIDLDTSYFVITANLLADHFQVSTTSEGAALNITADGFGQYGQESWLAISNNITPQFAAGALITSLS